MGAERCAQIAKSGRERALSHLFEVLQTNIRPVRRQVIDAVAAIRGREAREALPAVQEKQDVNIRLQADSALRSLVEG